MYVYHLHISFKNFKTTRYLKGVHLFPNKYTIVDCQVQERLKNINYDIIKILSHIILACIYCFAPQAAGLIQHTFLTVHFPLALV